LKFEGFRIFVLFPCPIFPSPNGSPSLAFTAFFGRKLGLGEIFLRHFPLPIGKTPHYVKKKIIDYSLHYAILDRLLGNLGYSG